MKAAGKASRPISTPPLASVSVEPTERTPLLLFAMVALGQAFVRSVVTLQLHTPFRPDALAYPAFLGAAGLAFTTAALGFVAAIALIVLSLRRGERSVAGFVLALAVTLFAFFVFNKRAFANYHFLVLAALAWAASLDARTAAG